jgi:hypothetical protein
MNEEEPLVDRVVASRSLKKACSHAPRPRDGIRMCRSNGFGHIFLFR